MRRPAELNGIAVVGAGSFNPAIFHPLWFSENDLIPENEAEHARANLLVSPQLSAFTADWLAVQVTLEQAIFSTVEQGRESDLRDVAKGVFDLLPHTPTDALGINIDAHYRIESEDEWHQVGDRFLPKDQWEPLFSENGWKRRAGDKAVGLRAMTVEAWHEDAKDFVRVDVAPSVRLRPWGVYIGINSHFQLTVGEERATGHDAAVTIDEKWDEVRDREQTLQSRIADWAP